MAIALGGNQINKAYLGNTEITKMYLGSNLVFDNTVSNLTPILTGFRIDNTNRDRVYFDTPLGYPTGLITTGFVITGKTISSVTQDGNGGYFTVTSSYGFYGNSTIRLGEITDASDRQTVMHNFTLQHVENQIEELTPTRLRYVTTTGGTGAGTEGDPWSLSHAFANALDGDKVYIQKGNYGSSAMTISVQGTSIAPIWFEGYDTDPGDKPTIPFTNDVTLDSNIMPLISTGSTSGIGITCRQDFIFFSHFQVSGFNQCLDFGGSDSLILDYVYAQNGTEKCINLWGNDGCSYSRVLNCHMQNASHEGLYMQGQSNLVDSCYATSNADVGMDYYFLIVGSSGNEGRHIIKNCTANRFASDSHPGHGFDLKMQHSGTVVEYCLVEECRTYNMGQSINFRHEESRFNIGRSIKAFGNRSEGNLITFRDGAHNNQAENCYGSDIDVMVKFRSNQGETSGVQPCGVDNNVINCIVYGCDTIVDEARISGTEPVPASTGNRFINNTFLNANKVYSTSFNGLNSTNEFINNIFEDDAGTITGTFAPTMTNNIIVNTPSLVSYVGSNGNIDIDPDLDASYQPQTDLSTIDSVRINGVYYDIDGNERQDPTTIGGKISAEEIPSEPPVTDYDFYVSEDGAGDGLTSDTPMSFAQSQTTINSMTNGQSIGYKGGDEFFGSLSVTGRTGITIGSYGTGKAIIRGSKDITTSFADTGSNMWTVSTGSDTAYQVFKDGELLTMGRLPKIPASNRPDLGYYDVTSKPSSSYTTIASSTGTGLPASGATAHISSESWVLEARTVQNYNSGTGGFTWSGNTQYDIELNSKYFLNNRLAFCTTQDEWYYSSGTLYIYSVGQPTGISINTISGNAFNLGTSNNITIKDLVVRDFYNNGFEVNNSDSVSIENCDIKNVYYRASNLISSQSFSITNCTIDRSNYSVMTPDGNSHDAVMSNNTITNLGVFENISSKNMGTSMVTESYGDRTITEYNHLTRLGYNGILLRGVASICRYNYIEDVSMMMDDGAAYYLHSSNYNDDGNLGTIMSYNIVVGHPFAVTWYSNGLYTDDRSRGATLEHNTCIGTLYGLYMHNCLENAYRYNNFYGTLRQCVYMQDDSIGDDPSNDQLMQNNIVQYNNMFVTSDNEKYAPIVWRTQWEFYDFGDVDFNRYFNPYYPTSIGFGTATINEGQVYNWNKYPLATWQSGYGGAINADANSVEDTLNWTYPEADTKSQCVYNATNSPVITPLVGTWYGMDGTEYIDEITLEPFTSEILINELAVPPTPSGELYPINDAASIDNEANLVASEWSYEIDVSIKSVTTSPQLGSYCLELEQTLGGSGKFRGLEMTVENGSTYNYSFWGKSNSGNARSRAWFGVVASPDHTMTSSWVQYSGSVTANSTTMTLNFQPNASAGSLAGDTMYVDTFTITKV